MRGDTRKNLRVSQAKLVSKSLIFDAVIPAPFLFLHGKIFLCTSFQQKLGSKAKPCVQRPAFLPTILQ